MHLFIGFTEVLLRFFIKGQLTSRCAEIIRLAFVFGCTGGGCGVNIHPADWIVNCCCHGLLLLFESIITVKDRFTNSHITQSTMGIIAYIHFSISFPACSQATMPPSRFQILVYPRETSSSAAIALMRPLRQYKRIFAFLSTGICAR